MSTKDLFNKSNKVLTKSQEEKIKKDLESPELTRDVVRTNNKFHSHIDFSNPENFSFYGSAQKYYEDSFNRVYQTYPYDGSLSEKEKWFYDSSELDLWILDNAYPKATGYVRLGTEQSIFVKGGPNNQPGVIEGEKEELSKQYPVKQGNSNIWDTSIYRNSNLYVDGSLGNTVEFWAKAETPGLTTYPFVLGNEDGQVIEVKIEATNDITVTLTDYSGAPTDFTGNVVIADFLQNTWNHYAFSLIDSSTNTLVEIYKNGVLMTTVSVVGYNLAELSQDSLYLNINGTMSAVNGTRSNTVDGLCIDEFRFWKKRRTGEEIGRYWHTHVNGGTNTDNKKYNTENRKVDIGIYYKFNEGITGDMSIDSTVLDYSGRISNGEIVNYSKTVRSEDSAFDESGFFEVLEEKEPIVYSAHPDFVSTKETYMQEGLTYDYTNNSSIYHTMPSWIIEEDEEKGENVKELSQVISSYFDSAQIKIKELVNLKDVEYHTLEERTNKPYSLIRRTLESAGMVVPDLFTEASAFEEILSRGEQEKFEEKLQDVKNTIYQNIYNNLSYIYKSKGTEKAFRNLIRCFGIDDELIKINLYSDGADYILEDTRRTTAIKKKFIDFNNADREEALVYTKEDPTNTDSISYIKGVPYGMEPNLSFTFETEVIFPKRVSIDHPGYDAPTNTEEHIAFLGKYFGTYTSNQIFDLKAVKEDSDPLAENVKFVLTFNGQTLETEYFKSVYENSKWNVAVRLVPKKRLSSVVSGGSTTDFTAELYCVRMLADIVEDEEWVVATVSEADARDILSIDKFVSIGALHSSGNPEVNSLNNDTRVKISSTLFWYDDVSNEEIRAHASDASNFGRLYPSEEAYMFDDEFNTDTSSAIQVPRRDTLALHWDFSEISTTDTSGEFVVDDLSESLEKVETPVSQNSIQFTGANSETIDIPDSDNLSFTDGAGTDNPFSISSWIKVGDITTDSGVIMSRRNLVGIGIADGEWIIGHNNGGLYVILYADPLQNGVGAFSTVNRIFFQDNVTKLTSATWHLITVTYDGTQNTSGLKVYKDGVQITTGSTTKNQYSGMANFNIVTTIGGTDSPVTNTFEDNIADTAVFDKDLSSAELIELYNGGIVKDLKEFSAYSNIISWWKMGDDLDTTGASGIKDYVGTNNGTLNGPSIQVAPTLSSDVRVTTGRFGWFTALVGYEVTGRGKHFIADDKQVVNREYIYSAKHRVPEVINSEDLVEIRTQDDLTFTKEAQVVTHFFAAEKSMYQVVSDDMINLFATIVEFNNLIGQPVNRYRLQYKALEKFRARYFEKVNNVPSLEKYIELYKWIDSSIGMMIQQLIPVSSNFSADLRNMVESHVLERNKYWTKFPTLEMAGEPPLGIVRSINELTYNWKDGHAPVGAETIEEEKVLYGDQRVQGTDTLVTTGDADVDENRETLRRVATRTTEGMVQVVDRGVGAVKNFVEENKPILRESPAGGVPGATYSGQTYVTRALAKPYKLNLDIAPTIHGGTNYSPTTKDPNSFVRASTKISSSSGISITFGANPVIYQGFTYDEQPVKRTINIVVEDASIDFGADGSFIYPYYETVSDPTPEITNLQNDSYGDDAEVPVQGPFTETWVGGNQHRHIHYATQTERPELFVDDAGTLKHPFELGEPAARYTRDELAKRPVNIENIKNSNTTEEDLLAGDETKVYGNYTRDYEIVQTSGRSKNNRWFVKNEGVSDVLTVAPIQGAQDFTLPDRTTDIDGEVFGKSKHVIVERFSAPGDPLTLSRGYLDRVAEEFSVYNSMNFRNLDEREEHHADLAAHSTLYEGSQGFVPDTNGLPNIHKVNRNTVHIPTGKNHDNAYISHQIPRSDFQYNVEMISDEKFTIPNFSTTGAAIAAGSVEDPIPGAGFDFIIEEYSDPIRARFEVSFDAEEVTAVANENLYFQYKLGDEGTWTTLNTFTSGTTLTQEDINLGQNIYTPIYIRWIARKAIAAGDGRWNISNITVNPVSFKNYLDEIEIVNGINDYADYQGAGYRFIRNAENAQVVNQRKTNVYTQLDRTARIGTQDRSTSTFVEPAVVWNKPNTHYVLNEEYDEKIRNAEAGSLVNVNIDKGSLPITYSYSNNLEMFSNENLTRAIDIDKTSGAEFSNTLMRIFRKAELLFSRSVAREIIFPKHKNVGLKKTRIRSEFDTYKFFWKDNMFDRIKCSNTTKLGYEMTPEVFCRCDG